MGFFGAVRTVPQDSDAVSWLQLPRPDALNRITLRPLSSRAVHAVITEALGRPVPRATMARIHHVSGGNPLYAIELAHAFDGSVDKLLPGTLAELVRARIGTLDPAVHDALLAAACVGAPTVEIVGEAIGIDHESVVELLEDTERKRIIAFEGNQIRFTHPLLARGVYTDAPATQRRSMHRRLADIVDGPELRAQHLAFAVTSADHQTLQSLDEAAASAHARGAPVAATELLELAIALGGATAERRLRLATHCFDAGDPGRARALLETAIATMPAGPLRAEALHTLAIVRFIDDGYPEASQLLQRALDEDEPDPELRVRTLIALAHALFNTGEPDAARTRAEEAVTHAEELGAAGLLSQALGVRAMLQFLRGDGIDEANLQRALALEDREAFTPTVLKPSVEHALILGWIGELDESYRRMQAIQRRCVERGEEGELIFIDFQVVLNRIWRGEFTEAKRVVDETVELARQLGGEFPIMLSLVVKACLAVYRGSEDEARPAVADAIDASKRSGSAWHEDWALTASGFLETSLGNYQAALNALEPLLSRFATVPHTAEIFAASFVPDAVASLIALGRVDEAEPLTDALERNGRRLDRAWVLAVGARCRAMVLNARGDVEGAVGAAQRAIVEHDRLPMPFERARTNLFLGQLQMLQQDSVPVFALREALAAFEKLETPRWAHRARIQLARTESRPTAADGLTSAEKRIAELAASGRTNRDVASELLISPKTVEATLARVYRKLGIRSRAELGQRMQAAGM